VVDVDEADAQAVTASAGEIAKTDQKDLGNLAAAIELYLRASRVRALAYAFTYFPGSCTLTAEPGPVRDGLIQKALELAEARARVGLITARERNIDAPLAYHYYRYGKDLAGGGTTREDKLLALEAFWRANAHARVLQMLGPQPPTR
jgi:hypothetical protein